jgi:hypothetical protein
MSWRWLSLAGPVIILLGGCGRSAPDTYPVWGTVTFDGKPVDKGDILFIPVDRSLGPEGGKIIKGKFSGRSKAGKCRVEISAKKEANADTPRFEGKPILTNYIPARYNADSGLSVDVATGNENSYQFKLASH